MDDIETGKSVKVWYLEEKTGKRIFNRLWENNLKLLCLKFRMDYIDCLGEDDSNKSKSSLK